jgi:hypothetical protein
MTQTAKNLLEEFDRMEEADQAEVIAGLFRRVAMLSHDLPDPDELLAAADQIFQIFVELDRREQSQ